MSNAQQGVDNVRAKQGAVDKSFTPTFHADQLQLVVDDLVTAEGKIETAEEQIESIIQSELNFVKNKGDTEQYEDGSIKTTIRNTYKIRSDATQLVATVGVNQARIILPKVVDIKTGDVITVSTRNIETCLDSSYKIDAIVIGTIIGTDSMSLLISDDSYNAIYPVLPTSYGSADINKLTVYFEYQGNSGKDSPATMEDIFNVQDDIPDYSVDDRFISLVAGANQASGSEIVLCNIPATLRSYLLPNVELVFSNDTTEKYYLSGVPTTNNYIVLNKPLVREITLSTKLIVRIPLQSTPYNQGKTSNLYDAMFAHYTMNLRDVNHVVARGNTEADAIATDSSLLVSTAVVGDIEEGAILAITNDAEQMIMQAYKVVSAGTGGVVDLDRPLEFYYPDGSPFIVLTPEARDLTKQSLFSSMNLGDVTYITDAITKSVEDLSDAVFSEIQSVDEDLTERKLARDGGVLISPAEMLTEDEVIVPFTGVPLQDYQLYTQANFLAAQPVPFINQNIAAISVVGEDYKEVGCSFVQDSTTYTVYPLSTSVGGLTLALYTDPACTIPPEESMALAMQTYFKLAASQPTEGTLLANIDPADVGVNGLVNRAIVQSMIDSGKVDSIDVEYLSLLHGVAGQPIKDTPHSITFNAEWEGTKSLYMTLNGEMVYDTASMMVDVVGGTRNLYTFTVTDSEWEDIFAVSADSIEIQIINQSDTSDIVYTGLMNTSINCCDTEVLNFYAESIVNTNNISDDSNDPTFVSGLLMQDGTSAGFEVVSTAGYDTGSVINNTGYDLDMIGTFDMYINNSGGTSRVDMWSESSTDGVSWTTNPLSARSIEVANNAESSLTKESKAFNWANGTMIRFCLTDSGGGACRLEQPSITARGAELKSHSFSWRLTAVSKVVA